MPVYRPTTAAIEAGHSIALTSRYETVPDGGLRYPNGRGGMIDCTHEGVVHLVETGLLEEIPEC